MKIGDFAKACGISVSALRYYDSQGLLSPVYTDIFTGYRYYDESQIEFCKTIGILKSANFSLSEIKQILQSNNADERSMLFEKKRAEYYNILRRLDEVQTAIKEVEFMKQSDFIPLKEDINIPFENDEEIIGRWELLADSGNNLSFGEKRREIYFLPEGEQYWCFSWTKGKFLFNNGAMTSVNSYTTEKRDDGLYMTIELKCYDYVQSGKTEKISLRQQDKKRYSKQEIARRDNINIPFKNDDRVIGKWYVFDYIRRIEDFSPSMPSAHCKLFFSEIEFLPGGKCISVYGDRIISDNNTQIWTKGFILRKFNETACAYEFRDENNKEFLFIEWKSGDYIWGGLEPNYYVFTRERRI